MKFRVVRSGPRGAGKDYGEFPDREAAERVALRSAEKYPGAVVVVEPVEDDRKSTCGGAP